MAEKLKRIQPTSSIANALNLDAVRAATTQAPAPPAPASPAEMPVAEIHRPSVVAFPAPTPPGPVARQAPPDPRQFVSREPTGEFANVMRQFQLTPSADDTLQRIIAAYGKATGLELTKSEFLRAVLHALGPTVDLHAREANTIGPLKRPKNEAWLFHKRDDLERAIARAFTAAMRAAPAME